MVEGCLNHRGIGAGQILLINRFGINFCLQDYIYGRAYNYAGEKGLLEVIVIA